MPALSTLTIQQLRGYTASQIAVALKNKIDTLTKRQLINLLLAIQDHDTDSESQIADNAVVTSYPDGQVKQQTVVVKDALGGKVRTERIDWTYYAPLPGRTQGSVKIIRRRVLDASDAVIEDVSTEHRDG